MRADIRELTTNIGIDWREPHHEECLRLLTRLILILGHRVGGTVRAQGFLYYPGAKNSRGDSISRNFTHRQNNPVISGHSSIF